MRLFGRTTWNLIAGTVGTLVCAGTLAAQSTAVDAFLGPPSTPLPRQQWQRRAIHGDSGQQDAGIYRSGSVSVPYANPPSTASGYLVPAQYESGLVPEPILTPAPDRIPGHRNGQPTDPTWIAPPGAEGTWDSHPGAGYAGGCSGCGDPACGGGQFDGGETWAHESAWCGDVCGVGCGGPGGWWNNLSLFAGVHGFKGPFDQGRNGNFGFQEGLNIGVPLGLPWPVGFQAGFQAVHSNFKGNQVQVLDREVTLQHTDRNQIFVTAGLFRRAMCGGFQWAIALDYLHDDYYDTADLTRIRSETGYVFHGSHEIGFWGAYGTSADKILAGEIQLSLDPTDMFALFYRRYFETGGEGRVWAGFTGRGDGILGADLRVPLGGSWGLENHANYVIAKHGAGMGGQQEESWGISINLVWYPGRPAACVVNQAFRPMMSVADNSIFTARLKNP